MINILFLASGKRNDNNYPLCLQEHEGKTLLQYFKDRNLKQIDANYTFIFLQKDIGRYNLANIAKTLIPESSTIALQGFTGGSACTALYGSCKLQQDIPLLIMSTNEIVDVDYSEILKHFNTKNADGGIMTFESVHPRYSYVRYFNSEIVELCQQNPISTYATTGSFWFKKTSYFVEAAKKSIYKNCVTSSQFYLAPVYNQMILNGMQIHNIDITGHYTPYKGDS